jgi:hypothetical protein
VLVTVAVVVVLVTIVLVVIVVKETGVPTQAGKAYVGPA